MEGKLSSGWLTMVSKDGGENLKPADDGDETVSDDDTASEAAPSPYAGSGLVPPSSARTGRDPLT